MKALQVIKKCQGVHDFVLRALTWNAVFFNNRHTSVALVDTVAHALVNLSKIHIFHDGFLGLFVCVFARARVCVSGGAFKNTNRTFEQTNSCGVVSFG